MNLVAFKHHSTVLLCGVVAVDDTGVSRTWGVWSLEIRALSSLQILGLGESFLNLAKVDCFICHEGE
ncbi:hypothetical protein NMG60_11031582 [Bertholletia excelsa]